MMIVDEENHVATRFLFWYKVADNHVKPDMMLDEESELKLHQLVDKLIPD